MGSEMCIRDRYAPWSQEFSLNHTIEIGVHNVNKYKHKPKRTSRKWDAEPEQSADEHYVCLVCVENLSSVTDTRLSLTVGGKISVFPIELRQTPRPIPSEPTSLRSTIDNLLRSERYRGTLVLCGFVMVSTGPLPRALNQVVRG